jgi:1-acyl-sn-glycerol-3-phosphate acyltransferase
LESTIAELSPGRTLLRHAAGFAVVTVSCVALITVLLPLLPFRGLRVRAGNVFTRPMSAVCLRLAGIRLQVEHHGTPEQRGIYVMNHSSWADPFLAMRLCPVGGCGVAKAEIRRVPFFGLAYWLSGHLLVDRVRSGLAVNAFRGLVPVIRRHRLGVFLWPEGTLSTDGRMLPFKRGFVHLAVATGLPVIPVVAHGAHRRWAPRTLRLSPGALKVEVLAAIDTTGWRIEDAEAHAADVRERIRARLPADQR